MANKIKASNITDGTITTDKIAPGTIASDRIAPGTIAADRLAGGITNSQLAGSIANAKLANQAITINGTSINLGASGNIVAGTDWQSVKTADFTAVASEGYFVNTTGGAITVTLPASPSIGDEIHIRDYAGTFASNNVTLNRNSSLIAGVAANGSLDTNDVMTTLVYVDGTKGWLTVDVLSVIPFDLIFSASRFNNLVRVVRASRLYKLVKLAKLVRILKVMKD